MLQEYHKTILSLRNFDFLQLRRSQTDVMNGLSPQHRPLIEEYSYLLIFVEVQYSNLSDSPHTLSYTLIIFGSAEI